MPGTQAATTASNAETHQHDNGLFRHPSNSPPIPRCGASPAALGTGGLGDRRSGPGGGENHTRVASPPPVVGAMTDAERGKVERNSERRAL